MARFVDEVMNRELLHLSPEEPARHALDELLQVGVTSAPVLDGDGRPIGVASLRDLVKAPEGATVGERMTSPPTVLAPRQSIEEAARQLVEAALHHAPVVDGDGRAVGFLSAMDALAALVGLPARHPPTFPHWDASLGLTWSDDQPLDGEHAAAAPSAAGVLALAQGGAGVVERMLWVEATDDLRRRLDEILASGAREAPQLAWLLEQGRLRFRFAEVADRAERERAAARVAERIRDQQRRDRNGI